MTKEEAIKFLKGYLDEDVYTEKCINAHNMAIKALEQQPCEDAISRQAAQAKIKSICDEYRLSYEDGERKTATGGSAYALGHAFDDLPPVTPIRPKEYWIPVGYDDYGDVCSYKCSECGERSTYHDNFCSNCGADMRPKDNV